MLNYALHNTTHIHFIQWILFIFFEFQKLLVNFHPCMISILWKKSRVSIKTISVFHNGWTSQILRIWQEENHLFQLPMLAPSLLGGKWNKQQQLCSGAGPHCAANVIYKANHPKEGLVVFQFSCQQIYSWFLHKQNRSEWVNNNISCSLIYNYFYFQKKWICIVHFQIRQLSL